MTNVYERRIDEIVSRVAATFAYYRREDGRWEDCLRLPGELRKAVAEVESIDWLGKNLLPDFFRALENEFVARYGAPMSRRLLTLVKDSSHSKATTKQVSS